ncbi:replication initiator [Streptosporangium sp. G11]|uniref:replication initiator n=1 Tax=Streptosporangium sp. G11 TaxID=3436926 RepID=UPI003EBA7B41
MRGGLRQPTGLGLPFLLTRLPGRHLPADPGGPVRRQGHPGNRQRAPSRVRHPDGSLIRTGAHPREKNGALRACRPRNRNTTCDHGRPVGCHTRHEIGDERLGQPICAECYDYTGAVLWQARGRPVAPLHVGDAAHPGR